MDLTDIYKIFYSMAPEYTFFKLDLGTFSKTDHIFKHQASLKYKKMETTFCTLSDHNGIKLEVTSKRHLRKYTNTWSLKNTFLND
jgi:hypothetical protein